jgi:hypothetical protein
MLCATAAELAELEEQGMEISSQLGEVFAQRGRPKRREMSTEKVEEILELSPENDNDQAMPSHEWLNNTLLTLTSPNYPVYSNTQQYSLSRLSDNQVACGLSI